MTRFLLLCSCALSALSAQDPAKPPAMAAGLDLRLQAPSHGLAPDGALLASGPDYRARFDAAGAHFTPFLGSDADRVWPVLFHLAGVDVGGQPLAVQPAMPVRSDDVVVFERGAAAELYDLRADGIEQRFLFRSLAVRGELRLHVDVTTDLAAGCGGDGITFTGPRGGVRYGKAVAIDGIGRRVAMTTKLVDGDLELVVPAAFVEQAVMPLLVDPLVSAMQLVATGVVQIGNADFAFDPVNGVWLAVWEHAFSASDFECYASRIDQGGTAFGSTIVIDSSGDSWRKPRVAYNAAANSFLVVAECDNAASSPWIGGRIVTISGGNVAVGVERFLAKSGLNGAPIGSFTNPDVGGDGADNGLGYWPVAYEYSTGGERDVHLRCVASDGSLQGANATLVATTAYDERGPRLSKSNGQGAGATQRWGLVYERRTSTSGSDVARLWCSLINRDGSLRSLLGQPTWMISDSIVADRTWDVSSPTDDLGGVRHLLAVESKPTASEGYNLFGILFDDLGVGAAPVDLTHLSGIAAPALAKDQRVPAVDSDGTRFAVAFSYDYSPTDEDVWVSTFARSPVGTLVAHEAWESLGTSTLVEDQPAICSRRTGSGEAGRYLVGYRRSDATSWVLRAGIYEGLTAGTIIGRGTACGSVSMTVNGTAGLAMPVSFALQGVTGVGGFLAGSPASVVVPGCVACTVGTTMDVIVAGSNWTLVVPNHTAIVGLTLAVQGFQLAASGPCLSQIHATNTFDITIR